MWFQWIYGTHDMYYICTCTTLCSSLSDGRSTERLVAYPSNQDKIAIIGNRCRPKPWNGRKKMDGYSLIDCRELYEICPIIKIMKNKNKKVWRLMIDCSYTLVTLEEEWAGMPSELKFFLHSWIFEVHSKNSDCILSAFQIFGPILVAGPNVFYHARNIRGAFEVEKYRTPFEVYFNCTLTVFQIFLLAVTAFQQHSKHSDRLRRRIETASHLKSCQNVPNAPRMSRNAHRMHFDCCWNLFRY